MDPVVSPPPATKSYPVRVINKSRRAQRVSYAAMPAVGDNFTLPTTAARPLPPQSSPPFSRGYARFHSCVPPLHCVSILPHSKRRLSRRPLHDHRSISAEPPHPSRSVGARDPFANTLPTTIHISPSPETPAELDFREETARYTHTEWAHRQRRAEPLSNAVIRHNPMGSPSPIPPEILSHVPPGLRPGFHDVKILASSKAFSTPTDDVLVLLPVREP